MTTLTKLSQEFFLSFEYKVTAYTAQGTDKQSVIHFTEGGNCCQVGERIPAVFVDNTGRLFNRIPINEEGNYKVDTDDYPLGQWPQVEFSQTLENDKFYYLVKVNGKMIEKKENTAPKDFSNVKVYAGNPWQPPLEGYIRNLVINREEPNSCKGKHRGYTLIMSTF